MIELVTALSPKEQIEFRKFLSSPYFNQNARIIDLYDVLRSKQKLIPDENELFRKEIFSSIYKNETFNDAKYRKLVSEFTDLFGKFLSISKFESDSEDGNYKRDILLLTELEERSLKRLFEQEARSLLKKLNGMISKDGEFYSASYDLDNLLFYFNYGKDADRAGYHLRSKSGNADLQYVFTKLHLFREMIIYNDAQRSEKEFSPKTDHFYNDILRFINKNKNFIKKDHPNFYFIYLTVMMYADNGEKYSNEFLNYLNGLKNDFPKEKLKYYYTYITSYYWSRINKGENKFRKDLLKAYKKIIEEDLLIIGKYLSDLIFNSVVMIGVSEKEFSWVEEFIEKYKNIIEPIKAKDALNLAYAKIFFYKKKYDDAVHHLNNVEFTNTIYFTNAKFLLAKLYYEQQDLISIHYLLESFIQYSKRNKKLIPEQVSMITAFVKYMKQLIRYREKDKDNIIVLKKELDNEKKYVPDRNWFYDKINEFIT
jgi:hypothetical protein